MYVVLSATEPHLSGGVSAYASSKGIYPSSRLQTGVDLFYLLPDYSAGLFGADAAAGSNAASVWGVFAEHGHSVSIESEVLLALNSSLG